LTRTPTKAAPVPVYQVRITLRGTKPPIWRRVAVPSDITLAELHEIIQIVMGWYDCHLHQFVVKCPERKPSSMELRELWLKGMVGEMAEFMRGERVFVDLSNEDLDMEGEDEREVTLQELCRKVKSKLLYEYDFGDGWEHTVEVQKIYPPEEGVRYPVCLAGKRACPPEDCGGAWGYRDMLKALANPKHPSHEDQAEWIGGGFDPAALNLEGISESLRRWRRHPRVVPGRAKRPRKRRS